LKSKLVKYKASLHLKRSICRYKSFIDGFTLVELMIVVVLIGIIAGFGIPAFERMTQKAQERTTIMEMISIHAGNSAFEAKTGDFLSGKNLTAAQISTGLSIDIQGDNVTYDYDSKAGKGSFKAQAVSTGGVAFGIFVDEDPIIMRGAGRNPCCKTAGINACPSLPFC